MQRTLLQGSNRNVCVLCDLRRVATSSRKRQLHASAKSQWTSGSKLSSKERLHVFGVLSRQRLRHLATEVVTEQRRYYDSNGLTSEEVRARSELLRGFGALRPSVASTTNPQSPYGSSPNIGKPNDERPDGTRRQEPPTNPPRIRLNCHESQGRPISKSSGSVGGQEPYQPSLRPLRMDSRQRVDEEGGKSAVFSRFGSQNISEKPQKDLIQQIPISNTHSGSRSRRVPMTRIRSIVGAPRESYGAAPNEKSALSRDERLAADKLLAGIGGVVPQESKKTSVSEDYLEQLSSSNNEPPTKDTTAENRNDVLQEGATLSKTSSHIPSQRTTPPTQLRDIGLTPEEQQARAALNGFSGQLNSLKANGPGHSRERVNEWRQTQYQPSFPHSRSRLAANQSKTFEQTQGSSAPSNWQHLRKKPSGQNIQDLISSASMRDQPKSQGRKQEPEDALSGLLKANEKPRRSYASFLPQRQQMEAEYIPRRPDQDAAARSVASGSNRSDAESTERWRPPGKANGDQWDQSLTSSGDSYRRTSGRRRESEGGSAMKQESDLDSALDRRAWADDPRDSRRRKPRDGDYDESYKKSKSQRNRRRDEDFDDEAMAAREERRRQKLAKKKAIKSETPTPISLPEYINVVNLAKSLKVRLEDFVAKLEELGFEDVQNDHILNLENASLVAMEFNFEPTVQAQDMDLYALPPLEDTSNLPARPPVVTIMGHVDHGKTTILDFLRKSAVADSEFGGITQHIGAFSVPLPSGKTITFLDTPGHSAFETMRKRGANVTDIVVLVVAADDSVKPQTIEAIKHAQAARVPIIVAINKIDKPEANPEAVKRDLMANGIEVEDFGGDVQAINVSGKTGQGLDDLEEAIVTLSEILDHRADTEGQVEGWVLEASTKKSGRVATVLVRRGTLRAGDILVAGPTWARVRSLKTEAGLLVPSAGPGTPVEVDGWREQPEAGDEALQASDEQHANDVVEHRQDLIDRAKLSKDMDAINESRRLDAEKRDAEKAAEEAAADLDAAEREAHIAAASAAAVQSAATRGLITVPFIIKADVSGSAEAILDSVAAIGNNEIQTLVLRSGVGPVYEFDVEHAAAAKGHVINFNTTTPGNVESLAVEKGVKILNHNIIYRLVDEIKALLGERLPPKIIQRVVGEAEIAQTFSYNYEKRKRMLIAGCKIRNGVIKKEGKARVLRDGEIIHQGIISSLKNVKKDVHEMNKGSECGMAFDKWEDFLVGDHVQHYEEVEEKRTL